MKRKILKEHSNFATGSSVFSFQNKYGKFCGWAWCNPEDMEHYSQYAGTRYAEIRAMEQYALFRLKQEKIKLQTIKNLLKDIEYDKKCSTEKNSRLMRRIKIKLRDYSQTVEDWNNLYEHLSTAIEIQDEERQKILNRTNKEKELS